MISHSLVHSGIYPRGMSTVMFSYLVEDCPNVALQIDHVTSAADRAALTAIMNVSFNRDLPALVSCATQAEIDHHYCQDVSEVVQNLMQSCGTQSLTVANQNELHCTPRISSLFGKYMHVSTLYVLEQSR